MCPSIANSLLLLSCSFNTVHLYLTVFSCLSVSFSGTAQSGRLFLTMKPTQHEMDSMPSETRDSTTKDEEKEDASSGTEAGNNNSIDHVGGQMNKELGENDENIEITEEDCYDELGYGFPSWKKWTILTIIFWIQVSMNFNASLYSNGLGGISKQFGVSKQAARVGAAVFLITYAFGCELWAPWSEDIGRKPVLQASLLLVNIWQLPVALAPNFGCLLVGRALGGLSSAGGSVTLGMIADMWDSEHQQYAVAYVVFSSVAGSALGPIVGGFVEQWLDWHWTIWIQLIFGGFVQLCHLLLVPETRSTILMDRIAKKRRKAGTHPNLYGPNELQPFSERFNFREILITWIRPFRMFLTEPIVLSLSLLSGFSDALIFMFFQSFDLVYEQWGFNDWQLGLAFVPIMIGYFIAWFSFVPVVKRNIKERHEKPGNERAQYESRLWWLLFTAPCLPIGLFGFAWTSLGPPVHWIGTMIFAAVIGIANYSIYMATIDYMICAYGPYSASATGGNGWSRDFLAGVLTLPATPFYTNIGKKDHVEEASTILACIAMLLIVAVYVIYWKGSVLRKRSSFAQQLHAARTERRVSVMPGMYGSRRGSMASRSGSVSGSRQGSIAGRPQGNRGQSYAARRAAEANREIENEKRDAETV